MNAKSPIFSTFIVFLLSISFLQAQNDHVYGVIVDGIIGEQDVKRVSHIIADIQEGVIISWRDDRTYAKIKSANALSEGLVEAALSAEGYHLINMYDLDPVSVESTKSISELPLPLPTGDPVQDAENYRLAKELWIKTNPELYENITKSASSSTTEPSIK